MKRKLKLPLLLLIFTAFFACRETEMNTDGNMEESEVEESEVIDVDEEEV